MSAECGAGGAYGIRLSTAPEVTGLYREFLGYIKSEEESFEDGLLNNPEELPGIVGFRKRFYIALSQSGIVIPSDATLIWTGSEDDRPAECAIPAEEWVLGFGLFTKPSDYPQMDKTFIERSGWYAWVWLA